MRKISIWTTFLDYSDIVDGMNTRTLELFPSVRTLTIHYQCESSSLYFTQKLENLVATMKERNYLDEIKVVAVCSTYEMAVLSRNITAQCEGDGQRLLNRHSIGLASSIPLSKSALVDGVALGRDHV